MGEKRYGRDFNSVYHVCRKIGLTRDRGELDPGVKFTPG